jgi:hypothetical protein
MNTETGQIVDMGDLADLMVESKESAMKVAANFIPVSQTDMTKKQLRLKQVSKFDNRSTLGRRFTEIRKSRNVQRLRGK